MKNVPPPEVQRPRAPRFDLLEVVLIAAFVALVAVLVSMRYAHRSVAVNWDDAEERALASRYGPDRNSEHDEEWIGRDYFHNRRNGFFVDVGANDYRQFSNTYYLETDLGWSGLAVEPQRQFEAGYTKYRPHSRFLPFFVSDVSNSEATMYYVDSNRLVTSSNKQFVAGGGETPRQFESPTITMDDLLAHEKVTTLDFLSIDIELAEPLALKGFDVERFRPAFVCIEAHPEVRQNILDYFARHHYVVVGKYLRVDDANLYFAPLSSSAG